MMAQVLDIILALYCPDVGQTPVSVVCFDRELAVVYPTTPSGPLAALEGLARRVLASGVAEHDVVAGSPLATSALPIFAGGQVVGVICVIENPTVAADGRQLLALAPSPIAVFDDRHIRHYANVAWTAQVSPDPTLSREATRIVDRVVESQEEVEFADVPFGSHRLAGVARPFASALGGFSGVAVTILSTERARDRSALAEAQLASRQKDQFIATISHELRAPLAAMLLWEKVLRDDALDPATRAKALDAIHESASSQSRLVADLLDVSRAINGKLHIDRNPVAIDEVVVAVVDSARPTAEQRHIEMVCELDARHHVLGDANRLRQIFANLIANAIKCSDPGGTVTVRGRSRDATIEIAIEDTGRGISAELLPHLFEPFRQASGVHDGGLGLGLAITSQLVTLHGGTVVASSAGLGKGATFRVTLPLAAKQRAFVSPPSRQRLGGVHVLVVDDDHRVLEALQLLLERAGAVVETASSADAGYGAVERAVPDVVLSDLSMPDEDGYSLMRRIRERERGVRRVPAVAMTAHVADSNRHDALAAGFDRYVAKPLDIDQLITTIAHLVPLR